MYYTDSVHNSLRCLSLYLKPAATMIETCRHHSHTESELLKGKIGRATVKQFQLSFPSAKTSPQSKSPFLINLPMINNLHMPHRPLKWLWFFLLLLCRNIFGVFTESASRPIQSINFGVCEEAKMLNHIVFFSFFLKSYNSHS